MPGNKRVPDVWITVADIPAAVIVRPGIASCRRAVSLSWPERSRARLSTRWTPITRVHHRAAAVRPGAAQGMLAGAAGPRAARRARPLATFGA